jgi:hypothetical protein
MNLQTRTLLEKILMKAKGGRIGYKHGGAAKRGHGCEIK